jgi:hypothetical protein
VRGIGSIGLGVSHRSGELPPSVWATIAKGILAGAIMALAFGLFLSSLLTVGLTYFATQLTSYRFALTTASPILELDFVTFL